MISNTFFGCTSQRCFVVFVVISRSMKWNTWETTSFCRGKEIMLWMIASNHLRGFFLGICFYFVTFIGEQKLFVVGVRKGGKGIVRNCMKHGRWHYSIVNSCRRSQETEFKVLRSCFSRADPAFSEIKDLSVDLRRAGSSLVKLRFFSDNERLRWDFVTRKIVRCQKNEITWYLKPFKKGNESE